MRRNILFFLGVLILSPFVLQAQSQKALPLKFTIQNHQIEGQKVAFQIAYKSFEGNSFSGKGTLHMKLSDLDSLWYRQPSKYRGIVGNGVISSLLADLTKEVKADSLQGKLGILHMKGSSAIKRKEVIWVDFMPDLSR